METLFYRLLDDNRLKRSMNILEMLYKARQTVEISEMEERLRVSQKTVYSALDYVKTLLPDTATLVVTDKQVWIEQSDPTHTIEDYIIEIAKTTIQYRLLRHLFYHGEMDICEVADLMYLSESTLRKRIRHINKVLSVFRLRISFSDVQLKGDETDIRYFFYEYFSEFQELFISVCKEKLAHFTSLYQKLRKSLKPYEEKPLHYSYQQITRWLFLMNDRMAQNCFVQVKKELAAHIKTRPSYRVFKVVYEAEMAHALKKPIPEAEVIWAYIVAFNSIVYTDNPNVGLFQDEADIAPLKKELGMILGDVAQKLRLRTEDQESFIATHSAYLINLSMLLELSPVFQIGYDPVQNFALQNLERLYIVWTKCLDHLKAESLIPISNVHSVGTQLAMISSQFFYNQKTQAKTVLYSFEGEAGLPAYLEALAKSLLPKGVEGVFITDRPIDEKLIQSVKPDIFVCNYVLPLAPIGCRILRMAHVPLMQEWTMLREMIISRDGMAYC